MHVGSEILASSLTGATGTTSRVLVVVCSCAIGGRGRARGVEEEKNRDERLKNKQVHLRGKIRHHLLRTCSLRDVRVSLCLRDCLSACPNTLPVDAVFF